MLLNKKSSCCCSSGTVITFDLEEEVILIICKSWYSWSSCHSWSEVLLFMAICILIVRKVVTLHSEDLLFSIKKIRFLDQENPFSLTKRIVFLMEELSFYIRQGLFLDQENWYSLFRKAFFLIEKNCHSWLFRVDDLDREYLSSLTK